MNWVRVILLTLGALVVAPQGRAFAYPWMNRHDYNNCASCHADPSGGGLLTQYGRAQSELLLSSRYSLENEDEEPGTFKDPLFGVVKLPDQLLLGAWLRNGYMWNTADGKLVDDRVLQMRADAAAQVKIGAFRASGSLGIATRDATTLSQQAALTSGKGPNLVSREYWLGWDLADDKVLIRAGRIPLPFGLRLVEHTSWVRAETRTDINQNQQHGVAVAFNNETLRAEVMAVVGNFQVKPDSYRDRGVAGYVEFHLKPGMRNGQVLWIRNLIKRRPSCPEPASSSSLCWLRRAA